MGFRLTKLRALLFLAGIQCAGASTPDFVAGLERRFDAAACPLAGDPAHRAPQRLREVERRLAAAAPAPDHQILALLDELAEVQELLQAYGEAEKVLQRALAARQGSGAPAADVMRTYSAIGLMQRAQGQPARTEATMKACLALAERESARDTPQAASCENFLGLANLDMGRYAEAEAHLQAALATRTRLLRPGHADLGHTHSLLGSLYILLGNLPRAEHHYLQALQERAAALGPCHAVVATALHFVADAYGATERYDLALRVRRLSVALRERVLPPGDHSVGHGLMGLGETLIAMRRYGEAEPAVRRSLEINRDVFGPRHHRALRSLWSLAALLEATGRPDAARAAYENGLQDASAEDTPEFLWRFQHAYAGAMRRAGNLDLAAYFGKQAVNTIQKMRAAAAALDRELQRTFVDAKTGVYRELADTLIELGRLPEAQQVLAMLKEEEYFDFIRRDARSDARKEESTLTPRESGWLARYQEVSAGLAALGAEQVELRRKARAGLSEAEASRRKEVDADLRVARLAFDEFLAALRKEAAQSGAERAAQVGERGLANLRALQGTLADLGQGAVTLHYVLGENRLSILLTTPGVQIGRSLDVPARELNQKIAQFRQALQSPARDPLPLAQEMYRILIGPVAADLAQAGAQTLMVSLDGALRYIPLAALHDGSRYLVESFRIAMYTEATRDRLREPPQKEWRLAGLGLTRAVEGFSPLPGVKQELESIVRVGERGILPGEVHLDDAFTAERLRSALDKEYPVLHLATHFAFQPGTEDKSFLLLGDRNKHKLTLAELRDYDFRSVDLMTLSACQTAVGGGRDANGQEIEGFGTLAQKQGARGVIATLWEVADESTAMLMRAFYELRESRSLTKAEALRQAQLGLLRAEAQAAAGGERGLRAAAPQRAARSLAHPYFWAPFILMGNWL